MTGARIRRGMHLTLRATATSRIGAGHAMRCLNLAQAWVDSRLGSAELRGDVSIPFVQARLRSLGIPHLDAPLSGDEDGVVLVDSYESSVREELTRSGALRVAVDDIGDWQPHTDGADVIWNPNPHGAAEMYPAFRGTVFAGLSCVPIREPLPVWSASESCGTGVALGGSVLGEMLRNLIASSLDDIRYAPVAAAGNWVPSEWTQVDSAEPWRALVRSRCVIVSAGTSAWEAAAIGVPAVVVCIAENQRRSYEWVRAAGGVTVDLVDAATPGLVDALRAALARPQALPSLRNGSPYVARQLYRAALARKGAHAKR